MKKKLVILIIILAIIALLYRPVFLFHKFYLTACPSDGPTVQDSFDLYYEDINLEKYNETLRSFSGAFDVSVIGQVEYQNESHSIYQLDKKGEGTDKNLLIFAATHGDEFASALAIPAILENIASNEIYADWNIRVVTPINPVGLINNSRYNKSGCDINRDFKEFRTLGAQLQKQAIDEFQPTAVLSLHEGPQEDFFVIGTQSAPMGLAEAIVAKLAEEGVDLAPKTFLGFSLNESGIMHEGSLITNIKRIFGIHTLGRYAESKGSFAITTESSRIETDVQKRIDPHVYTVEAVVEYFNSLEE